MEPLVSIPDLIERHFQESYDTQCKLLLERDRAAIRAAQNQNEPRRVEILSSWIKHYGAQPRVKNALAPVTRAILAFLDAPHAPPPANWTDRKRWMAELASLMVEACKCSGKFKSEYISLSSKVLWCKYPKHFVILDGHVERSLQTLSRLHCIETPRIEGRYEQFIHCWLELYMLAKPEIVKRLESRNYPYPVRIFDKILWMLGQRGYGGSSQASSYRLIT